MTKLDRELASHREALSACRRCGHGAEVRPIVSLARNPRVMLVGQAPGKVEAGGGAPFSGRAGRALFGWFARIGLDEATLRSRMYIAAITRCFPGPSRGGRGDRVPGPAERAACAPWLHAELRLIRPALVVPVGRLAIDALLGPLPLDQVVGREHRVSAGVMGADAWRASGRPDAVVIPLPHPSGASSWIHAPGHRDLLERALDLISVHWRRAAAGRRVA